MVCGALLSAESVVALLPSSCNRRVEEVTANVAPKDGFPAIPAAATTAALVVDGGAAVRRRERERERDRERDREGEGERESNGVKSNARNWMTKMRTTSDGCHEHRAGVAFVRL